MTTEILKRAENVIFSKSNVIRLNQDKERSKDSPPLTSVIKKVEVEKKSVESFHVIVPVDSGTRSVEIKAKSNKSEPVKASIKERLGKKVTERSRSRSRSRKRYDGDTNKSRRPDSSRKHISSCISTVTSMSKTESRRSREKVAPRRSRSPDRRDNRTKRYARSRSKEEEEARSHRKPGTSSSADHRTIRKDHKKRRSDSPRSPEGNERKKLRSSSVESKKHKKKKKKEKKSKKKSHDRK